MAALVQEHEPNLLPPADLAGEIDKLQEDLRNERDRNLRTPADFKNYRRHGYLWKNELLRAAQVRVAG